MEESERQRLEREEAEIYAKLRKVHSEAEIETMFNELTEIRRKLFAAIDAEKGLTA